MHRLVEIYWRDIKSLGDWNEPPDTFTPPLLCTPGYLIDISAQGEYVLIASTFEPESGTYADHCTLPLGCVTRIRYLGETEDEEVTATYTVGGRVYRRGSDQPA